MSNRTPRFEERQTDGAPDRPPVRRWDHPNLERRNMQPHPAIDARPLRRNPSQRPG